MSAESAEAQEQRLRHYAIKGPLGRGGMGEVFLAWDERLERHVAIKRIRRDRPMDARRRARFRREARAIARLSHPVIVQIFELLESDGGEHLVMEYVEGTSLSRLLASSGGGGLGLALAVALGAELADGLAQAHAKGILHRDLKLENVVVTPLGHAKILDFGLAYHMTEAAAPGEDRQRPESGLTESGMLVGTAYAMSPEQARGAALDPRSDLFALGGILYAMLTGRPPFGGGGSDVLATLHRVAHETPIAVQELRPDAPAELAALVEKLLAKEIGDRPASAREVARQLERLASATPPRSEEVAPEQLAEMSTASALPARQAPPAPQPEPAAKRGEEAVAASQETLDEHRGKRRAPRRTGPPPAPEIPLLRVLAILEAEAKASPATLDEARALLPRYHGRFVATGAPHQLTALFERASDAVGFALALQASRPSRIALHLGEVKRDGESVTADGARGAAGSPLATCGRVLAMTRARQILITRSVFDLARRATREHSSPGAAVRWLAHGSYVLAAVDAALELFEVGVEGTAPLLAPGDSAHGKRAVAHGDEDTLGWRPASGQPIPRRPNWILRERLGEGGSGEVWLAAHPSGEHRVFKFCFEPARLRGLQREITLFRLLADALGHRHDIARILDWSVVAAPYFVESEYTEAGDLEDWADGMGGLAEIALGTRLRLAAEVAEALAAAHSVGVLHKDVKPQNVLVTRDRDGQPRARLADFGIGMLLDREALARRDISALGFSETLAAADSQSGSRRYLAPELAEGKPATIQADLYALGVMIYQLVAGDFHRVLAPGWERDISDELLAGDIAELVDGQPERRPASAQVVAERLRSLDERRRRRDEAARRERAARRAGAELEEARKRRRAARWGAGLLAISLAVVSGFAYRAHAAQAREQAARAVAEKRRHQAEALIEFMLVDLRAKLEPLGQIALLAAVGDQAQTYFAAVPQSELSDEELQQRSTALHQLGQVRMAMGQLDQAARALRESLVLAEQLVQRRAGSAELEGARRFALGQSQYWMGYLAWKEGDLPSALVQLRAYLRTSEELVARDPRNRAWVLELAYAHSNLGTMAREMDDLDEASRALTAAAGLMESLLAQAPGDDALVLELAHVQAKLGDLLMRRGELAAAEPWLLRYRDALVGLVQRSPDDLQRLRFLGYAHSHLGDLRRWRGDQTAALAEFRAALAVAERLVAQDGEDASLAGELMLAEDKLAEALIDARADARSDAAGREHLEQAAELLDRERQRLQALTVRDPDNTSWRDAQVRMRLTLARLAAARGDLTAATALARAAVAAMSGLAAPSSDAAAVAAAANWQLGALAAARGDRDEATQAWRRGRQLLAPHAGSQDPAVIDLRARLALVLGDPAAAAPLFAELDRIGYRVPALVRLRGGSGGRGGK